MAKIHQALWLRFLLLTLLSSMASAQMVPKDDTYVSGATPTTAAGSSTSLVVQGSTTVPQKPSFSYVRFDFTSLNGVNGAQVQTATLRLYVTAVSAAGNFDVIELTSPTGWTESTLIYNTSGASSPAGTPRATNVPVTAASKSQYIYLDVTPSVVNWLSGGLNNGFALVPSSGYASPISASFSSKEDTTYSHEPTLIVVVKPGGTGVQSVTAGSGITVSGTSNVPIVSLTSNSLTVSTTGGLTGGAIVSLGGTLSLTTNGTALATPNTLALRDSSGNLSAATFNGSFSGSGSGLTGLNASSISSGTLPDVRLSSNVALLNAGNLFTGSNTFSNASNTFAGSFTGNGAGLSNVNAASLNSLTSAAFAQLGAASNTFSGSIFASGFNGSGAGLTNIPNAALPTTLVYSDQANTYTAGKKQTFVADPSAGGLAGLNVAAVASDPPTLATGDLWLTTGNAHLQFKSMSGLESLAFLSDITAANSNTLTSANQYTDAQVLVEKNRALGAEGTLTNSLNSEVSRAQGAEAAEASTRMAQDAILGTAIAGETARASGAESTLQSNITALDAASAKLSGGNIFLGGSQTLAASTATYPSFNVPNSATPLTTPVIGDVWLLSSDPHLNFQDKNNVTQMLAFFSDITTANNAQTTALNNEITRATGAEATLTTNLNGEISRATGAESILQGNINAEAVTRAAADSAEVAARILGDAAALSSANTYTDTSVTTEKNRAMAAEALKANLDGGNIFTNGKQALAGSTATFASLNIPNGSVAPDSAHIATGDIWLLSGDTHLQFRDNAGTPATHSLMFTDDTVNGTNLSAGSVANTALANSSVTVTAGLGLSGGGTVALGGSLTLTNAGVTSFNGSTGAVSGVSSVTAGNTGIAIGGTAASPTVANAGVLSFNGNTGNILAVFPASTAAVTHQFFTSYNALTGAFTQSQPAFADLTGTDSATSFLVYNNQANTYGAGQKQTFTADATPTTGLAGLNIAGTAGDAGAPAAGDLWFNDTNTVKHLRFFDGATTKTLAFTTDVTGGTVTSVATGTGLTGGPITTSGTISLLAATASALGGVKALACASGSHFSGVAVDGTLTCTADATTSSLSFSAITSGTSSGQSLVVGNGSTLAPTGTGTITATSAATATLAGNVTGVVAIANGGTGITTSPSAAGQYLRSSAANTWAVNGVQTSDLTGAPVRVTASTTSAANPNAGTTATAVASCAAGRVLLGGGAQVTNTQAPDMAVMSQSFPSSTSPGQWTALGVVIKNMNAGNTMTVTAYALCSGT